MKNISAKYGTDGKIASVSESSLFFEQENESLTVTAELPEVGENISVRAYIKGANNNSTVTDAIVKSEAGTYDVTISSEYMSSGTLYVGYELYNSEGYAERLEPLKIYIDSWVTLGNTSSGNVYVVTVNVGSVETLEAGSDATVTNSGTEKDMVLNFGIPKGEKGDKGDTGDKGEKGDKGDRGEKGEPFVYSDFTAEQLALLKGEKGDKGDTGAKGEQGEKGAAFVYSDFTADQLALLKGEKGDKGDTGAKGEQGEKGAAFVYSDFTADQLALLKGEKGDKGDTGAKGEQGIQGIKGDSGHTPVRGTDYWTEDDKNEVETDIKGYTNEVFSNSLKGSQSGVMIGLDDISPIEHEVGVSIVSKNRIPYPYEHTTKTEAGITFTDNGDGSITLNGTATGNAQFYISLSLINKVDRTKTYVLSGGKDSTIYLLMDFFEGATWKHLIDTKSGTQATVKFSGVKVKYDKIYLTLNVLSGTECDNVIIKPQLEEGTTATGYTPYISDLTSVTVKKCGKNLIPFPYASNTAQTVNGVTYTPNSNGSIVIDGTATGQISFEIFKNSQKPIMLSAGTYFLSGIPSESGASPTTFYMQVYYDGKWGVIDVGSGGAFTVSDTVALERITLFIKTGVEFTNLAIKPQLEVGTTATEYEQYNGETYTPSADGTVAGVKSLYPITTLLTNNSGSVITAEYNRDINKAFSELEEKLTNAILSTGGNV